MSTTSYVDALHASNNVTSRSNTGLIIFLNIAPTIWYSKSQNSVKSSTFSSEFIAMKSCIDQITALRSRLRMFKVLVLDSTDILCNNKSGVNNYFILNSTLNKKHSSIAYNSVQWNVAPQLVKVAQIDTNCNLPDAFTKRLTSDKRDFRLGIVLINTQLIIIIHNLRGSSKYFC